MKRMLFITFVFSEEKTEAYENMDIKLEQVAKQDLNPGLSDSSP